jgi:hypothetical protein
MDYCLSATPWAAPATASRGLLAPYQLLERDLLLLLLLRQWRPAAAAPAAAAAALWVQPLRRQSTCCMPRRPQGRPRLPPSGRPPGNSCNICTLRTRVPRCCNAVLLRVLQGLRKLHTPNMLQIRSLADLDSALHANCAGTHLSATTLPLAAWLSRSAARVALPKNASGFPPSSTNLRLSCKLGRFDPHSPGEKNEAMQLVGCWLRERTISFIAAGCS